jgi:hypothetical protein
MGPTDDVPGGDWELPPIEPADELIGWTPEPAVPEPMRAEPAVEQPAAAESVVPESVVPESVVPESVVPEPVAAEPVAAEPVAAEPVRQPYLPGAVLPAAVVTEATEAPTAEGEAPPSAGVLPVPRRTSVAGAPVSPMRALAGAAVAVAGVMLGIGALLWATDAPKGSPALQQAQAQSSRSTPSPTPSPSPSADPTTAAPAPLVSPTVVATPAAAPKLALTVLNNSNVNKLAARAAAKYHAAGWPIKLTGAFRGRIPVTTVYYAPGQQASAMLLQKEFPAIARVRPRFKELPGSGLTVVLTRDYPA